MKTAIIAAVVGIVGIGIGYASAAPAEDVVVAEATPTIVPTPTSVPTPEPTPRVVTETVTEYIEVTPQSCIDAIDWMLSDGASAWTLISALYGDYVDFPEENLAEFGARVEERLSNFDVGEDFTAVEPDIDACLAAS